MDSKPWYASKTVIFNVLYLVLVVAGAFGFNSFQPSAEVAQFGVILGMIVPLIINLILRFKTKVPIK